ncbi:hypothetical protein BH09BAC6_BH09BAC6_22940 [soil metagenome]|jgi:hypothetical protein
MKRHVLIVANVFGSCFVLYALVVLYCWVFHVDIFVPKELRILFMSMVIGMIILIPIISFVMILWGKQVGFRRLLPIIYLVFWLIVLTKLLTDLN